MLDLNKYDPREVNIFRLFIIKKKNFCFFCFSQLVHACERQKFYISFFFFMIRPLNSCACCPNKQRRHTKKKGNWIAYRWISNPKNRLNINRYQCHLKQKTIVFFYFSHFRFREWDPMGPKKKKYKKQSRNSLHITEIVRLE